MGFVVKNTTKVGLLDLICPHICRGCGRLGAVLCECCKNNILEANLAICPLCKSSVAAEAGKCRDCELPFLWLGVVGWREGALAKVVKDFKYKSVRAAGEVLAEMIDVRIPRDFEEVCLRAGLSGGSGERGFEVGRSGAEVVVVPLPTIGRHVRERGLDHTVILAKKLAKRRGWKWERVLGRATDTVQVGAKAAERKEQAAKTYEVVGRVEAEKIYLLVDDVWTTGATMLAAEKALREAGAKMVAGVVVMTGRK